MDDRAASLLAHDRSGESRRRCVDTDAVTAALALVNAALGAGVLAYPFAFMSAGMVTASALTALLGGLSFLSLCIIMHCMSKAHAKVDMSVVASYSDLIQYGLGPKAAAGLEVLILIYMFGACVGYLEVLRDVFGGMLGPHRSLKTDMITLAGASAVCCALSMLRQISALKYSAAAAVLATLFTVGTLIYQAFADPCTPENCHDENHHPGWTRDDLGVSLWPLSLRGVFKSLPLIAFAMQCHIQCAAAYCEMPARLRRSVRGQRGVAVGAIALVLALYFPAGIAGFTRYGDATNADILYNFSVHDIAADAARLCMALAALSAFPCQHYPARTILHAKYRRCQARSPVVVHATPPLPTSGTCQPDADVPLPADQQSGGQQDAGVATNEMSCSFAVVEAIIWTLVVLVTTMYATVAHIELDLVFQVRIPSAARHAQRTGTRATPAAHVRTCALHAGARAMYAHDARATPAALATSQSPLG